MKVAFGGKKVQEGVVSSVKMDKTISVVVERRLAHPTYRKYYKLSKKFLVHDEKNDCGVGDLVRIIECRPISKRKRFRLLDIVKRKV